MTREEIQNAITDTLNKILQVKNQIEKTTDPMEQLRLLKRKKELQIRQLWNIDQLEALREEPGTKPR